MNWSRRRTASAVGDQLTLSGPPPLSLAERSDARPIAEMSRDLIEQGLSWSWTHGRVRHSIGSPECSVVVARPERCLAPAPISSAAAIAGSLAPPTLAAFAIMHFGDDSAHLNLLAVAPEYRRQGLGRKLMNWMILTAVEAGIFRINLELRVKNSGAQTFYENLGFSARGMVHGYYQGREAALRMTRDLTHVIER